MLDLTESQDAVLEEALRQGEESLDQITLPDVPEMRRTQPSKELEEEDARVEQGIQNRPSLDAMVDARAHRSARSRRSSLYRNSAMSSVGAIPNSPLNKQVAQRALQRAYASSAAGITQVTSSPTLSYHRSSRAEGSPKASSPKASLSGQLRARSLSHPVVDVNAPMAKEPRRLNVDVDSSNPLAKKGAFTLVAESSPRDCSARTRWVPPVRTARRFPHDDTGEGLGLGRSDGALPVLARHATVPAVSFAVSTAPVYGQSSRRARSASYSSNNDKRARSASYSSNNDNSPVLSTSAHPSFYKPELGSNNSQFSSTSSLPDAVPPRAGTDNNNTPGDSRQGSISEELGGMPKFGQHSRQDSKNSMSAENASVVVEFSGESPDHSAADSTEHTEQRTEAPAIQDSLEAQLITKILLREGNSSSPPRVWARRTVSAALAAGAAATAMS
eukprot:g75267.t1